MVTVEHFKESVGSQGLALYPEPCRAPGTKTQNVLESDTVAREGPSSNSSFHSSEEEGTDLEGDMLDCSGSRPLLLESEEEDENCRPLQGKLGEATLFSEPGMSAEPEKREQDGKNSQFLPVSQQASEGLGEPDVFATAPFRSSLAPADDMDIFSKAPFVSKGSVAPSQTEEVDVFSRAPFTKKRSVEEFLAVQVSSQDLPVQASLSQPSEGPLLPGRDRAGYAPAQVQCPVTGFVQQASLSSHSVQVADHFDSSSPKGSPIESGGHPNDRGRGLQPQKEAFSGQVAGKLFRSQALSKYSRHYSPEDEPSPEAQPIAAYKVVSQSSKQLLAGSVSVTTVSQSSEQLLASSVSVTALSSRTTELPAADPFALAPFPSKASKQKP